jgi:hypothetical protein
VASTHFSPADVRTCTTLLPGAAVACACAIAEPDAAPPPP